MERLGEVPLEDLRRRSARRAPGRRRGPAARRARSRRGRRGDRSAVTRGMSSPVFKGRSAGACTVQTPSRCSRQNGCSGWSDFRGGPNSRSRAVRSGSASAKRHLGLALLPPAERVEDQQRLVRGALVALPPDVQVVEPGQDGVGQAWALRKKWPGRRQPGVAHLRPVHARPQLFYGRNERGPADRNRPAPRLLALVPVRAAVIQKAGDYIGVVDILVGPTLTWETGCSGMGLDARTGSCSFCHMTEAPSATRTRKTKRDGRVTRFS